MCLYPKLIKNKKYMSNGKNRGKVPVPKDERVLFVPVACGKCFECMRSKKRMWQVRLYEELKVNKNGKFVTLTFSDESLNELERLIEWSDSYYVRMNAIATLAVRRFLERWRKKFKVSVRHWLVTELGQTSSERIHLHGILWTDESEEIISDRWHYGHVWIGDYVNERTVNYIVKYLNKQDFEHKNYMPKMLCSKGIGANYVNSVNGRLNKYRGDNTREEYVNKQGFKLNLPVYYRNKIYDDDQREMLWLKKLDEEVRYVDGVKIDVSVDEDDYLASRNEARLKNTRLGYGSDAMNYDEREYRLKLKKIKLRTTKLKDIKKENVYFDIKNDINRFESAIDKLTSKDILKGFNNEV